MKRRLKRLLYKLRLWWGPLTTVTMDTMEAWGGRIETEHEVRTARGQVVGYWAYGAYNPFYPYQGPDLHKKT